MAKLRRAKEEAWKVVFVGVVRIVGGVGSTSSISHKYSPQLVASLLASSRLSPVQVAHGDLKVASDAPEFKVNPKYGAHIATETLEVQPFQSNFNY